jgi:hypothetical protein
MPTTAVVPFLTFLLSFVPDDDRTRRSSKTTNAAYKFVEQSDVRLWHKADIAKELGDVRI